MRRARHGPCPAVGVGLDHRLRIVAPDGVAARDRVVSITRRARRERPSIASPPDAHERQRRFSGLHASPVTARDDAGSPRAVEDEVGARSDRAAAFVSTVERDRGRRSIHGVRSGPTQRARAWRHQIASGRARRRRAVSGGARSHLLVGHGDVAHRHPGPHVRSGALRLCAQDTVEVASQDLEPAAAAERRGARPRALPADGVAPGREEPRGLDRFPDADGVEDLAAARGQRLGEGWVAGVGLRQQQDGVAPGRQQARGGGSRGPAPDDGHVDRRAILPLHVRRRATARRQLAPGQPPPALRCSVLRHGLHGRRPGADTRGEGAIR